MRSIAGTALCGVYAGLIAAMMGLVLRLYILSQSAYYAAVAGGQSSWLLEVDTSRGQIYDCELQPLVSTEMGLSGGGGALCPGGGSTLLGPGTGTEGGGDPTSGRVAPFVIEVEAPEVYAPGVEVFSVSQRSTEDQTAVHLIGYLDQEGHGVTGIEAAYDTLLTEAGGTLSVRYTTDTMGRALATEPPEVVDEGYNGAGGVVLTIDREIQLLAEEAAARHFEKGAVVVLDVHTGEIRAMASLPVYDPENVAAALDDPDTPLINRALLPYSVGSTFKVLVAATALEQGYAATPMTVPAISRSVIRFFTATIWRGTGCWI